MRSFTCKNVLEFNDAECDELDRIVDLAKNHGVYRTVDKENLLDRIVEDVNNDVFAANGGISETIFIVDSEVPVHQLTEKFNKYLEENPEVNFIDVTVTHVSNFTFYSEV